MTIAETYFYDEQIRRYLVQFAAVFQGIQVMVGQRKDVQPQLIQVPIKNASSDRVVAAIKSENTQNKPIRLPIMTFSIQNIEQAPELRKGVGTVRRNAYVPTGGLIPNDISVVEQRMPVPYRLLIDFNIFVSNQDQHMQILEQILTIFDPILQIQTSDGPFDWTKITTLELLGVQLQENVPAGADRRFIQTSCTFDLPIYLSIPVKEHKRIVQEILLRVEAVSASPEDAYDVISTFDSLGIDYSKLHDFSEGPDI